MRYKAVVLLHPTSIFGLPSEGTIVFPATPNGNPATVTFPSVDSTTLERTSWGTLSRFREDKDAVMIDSAVRDCRVKLIDNYLSLEFSVADPLVTSPWDVTREVAISICGSFTLLTDSPFDFKVVSLQQLEGAQKHLRSTRIGGSVTAYNLIELTSKARESMEVASIRDPTLEKALTYNRHGAILRDSSIVHAWDDRFPHSTQATLFESESFLNYWKAATTIIGDRTKGDSNEERGLKLGLGSDYYKTEVQPLTSLRNDYDVAHYNVQLDRAKQVSASLGQMVRVAKVLLISYVKYLQAGGSPFTPRNP